MTRSGPRAIRVLALLAALAALLIVALLALGQWQVQRLAWKSDLIARVNARIHAAPMAAPTPGQWTGVTAARDEYRRIRVIGRFDHMRTAFVLASTNMGSGYWTMTPLRTEKGFTIWINRGFVTSDQRARAAFSRPQGQVTLTGLLRITEPKGGFLRDNAPDRDRWYSRDVAALSVTLHPEPPVAPYFIDADAMGRGAPAGGLTVIAFPNNHLVYALTWFTLAAMVAMGYGLLMRWEWMMRRRADRP